LLEAVDGGSEALARGEQVIEICLQVGKVGASRSFAPGTHFGKIASLSTAPSSARADVGLS
jgi:hypothetical protein